MPDLRDLIGAPERVADLTHAEAACALVLLAALQASLAARLQEPLAATCREGQLGEQDRLLTANDVAERLGCSVDWVYRQAKRWPFSKPLGRKTLRFSEAGLNKWIAARKP